MTIEGFSNNKSKIIILDNLGKEVMPPITKESGFISETIDLTKLENGIYFIKIDNGKSQAVKKVAKQ